MAIGQCGIKEKNKHRNIKFIDKENRMAVTRGRGLEGGGRMSELFFGFQFK